MVIKCLYLEDDDTEFNIWSQTLKRAVEELEIVRAHAPSEAIKLMEDDSDRYQLFVADLLIAQGDEEKSTGLLAVEVAARNPKLAILGLSKGEGSHPGITVDFFQTAPHGKYVDKRFEPPRYTLATLKKDIKELLLWHGHWLDTKGQIRFPKLPPGQHLELEAEIESIGEATLLALLRQIQEDCVIFEPHYVAPGYSGAIILRIVAYHDGAHPSHNLLVKLSRESAKLDRELDRAPGPAEPSAGIYVPYLPGPPRRCGGWNAIAARFESDATTLQDWLLFSKPSASSVKTLLSEVFLYGLKPAYLSAEVLPHKSAISELFPRITSLARMRRAIQMLKPVIERTDQAWNDDLLLKFIVEKGRVGSHSAQAFPVGTACCVSHGDLHSRNILITLPNTRSPGASLIDPARRQRLHWASDTARLATDLWISCVDSVGGQSAFWDSLPLWRESVAKWAENQDASGSLIQRNESTWVALKWLRDQSRDAFGDLPSDLMPQWQFYLTMVLEFLHLSIYDNVPTPKRALSLLAAGDLLTILEGQIPWTPL